MSETDEKYGRLASPQRGLEEFVGFRVPKSLIGLVDDAVDDGVAMNRSQLAREAVAEHLRRHGYDVDEFEGGELR